MTTNLSRLNKIAPNSARHVAHLTLIEEIVVDLCKDEKLALKACRAFRRLEYALYYLNPWDRPTIELTRKHIATRARLSPRTVASDLQYINDLFDSIGLRLQHWESGGLRWSTNAEGEEISESAPSIYYWPSPGGQIIEAANEKIMLAVGSNVIPARNLQTERRIFMEMILKKIDDPEMQETHRLREMNRTVKAAVRADRKDDREQLQSEVGGNVVQFPTTTKPISPVTLTQSYAMAMAAQGLSKKEVFALLEAHYALLEVK